MPRSSGAYGFKNLISWQKAQELTVHVLEIVRTMPRDRASDVLARQVIRSSSSIAATIAEGHGRFSAGAYRNHLSIARGSAMETMSWLDLMRRTGHITTEREQALLKICDDILNLISAKMIELDKQTGTSRTLREERGEYDASDSDL